MMLINTTQKPQKQGFVIYTYTNEQPMAENLNICKVHSSPELKDALQECVGRMYLRMLTKEEKAELEQYKKEQKGN